MEPEVAVEIKSTYEDKYFSIRIDEEERLLFYKILGYPKCSEMIRHGHDELYKIAREMQKERGLLHLVADLTDAKILLKKDIRFIGTVSYPRLAKTGIRNLAILLRDDFHVKMNVKKTIECLGPNVFRTVMQHPSLEHAKQWFNKLPSSETIRYTLLK